VANAAEVTVRLADKREFKAKVVGIDRRTDVALIRIDAKDLPSVRIGDPAKVKVGEWVAAIGSPFGLESTVTAGIVSAKSRALPDDSYVPFIQTDVAINPGNSGGPLFNMQGEVIGINSQIYSRTGGYMGLSFSIPIDVAMKVEGDLQKFGRVSRGRLGIGIQPLGAELAESFGLAKPQGALVSSVEPKSAAERAGLKSGDVILSVDGKPIEQTADLPRIVGEAKPGTEITLEVWRERSSRKIRASLGEAPGEALAEVPAAERAPDAARLGIAVRPLTAEEKRRVSLDEGLVVESASGAAARAGIRTGDIILGANSEAIRSTEDLKRAVDKAQGRVALLIQRDGSRIFVPVRTG
jgi:serine protease Do